MWVAYADEVFLKEDSFAVAFVGSTPRRLRERRLVPDARRRALQRGRCRHTQYEYAERWLSGQGRDSWACRALRCRGTHASSRAVGLMTINR